MNRSLEYYYWYKEHGICVKCKKEKADNGIMCLKCRMDERERRKCKQKRNKERATVYQTFLRQIRREEHKCIYCGRQIPMWDKRKTCGMCRAKYNRHKREKSNSVPSSLRGDGIHCHICFKEVESKGAKLCNRCYANCLKNLSKVTPEGRERSKARFKELNTIFWNEKIRIRRERDTNKIKRESKKVR